MGSSAAGQKSYFSCRSHPQSTITLARMRRKHTDVDKLRMEKSEARALPNQLQPVACFDQQGNSLRSKPLPACGPHPS